jgi:hypothetical protein
MLQTLHHDLSSAIGKRFSGLITILNIAIVLQELIWPVKALSNNGKEMRSAITGDFLSSFFIAITLRQY